MHEKLLAFWDLPPSIYFVVQCHARNYGPLITSAFIDNGGQPTRKWTIYFSRVYKH